ncbi:MAG: chromosome partitioning protein ParB, partial [Bacteroidales bacterium]
DTKPASLSEEYSLLKNHLSKFFHTKVQFSCDAKGKGKISIPFKSDEELQRILGIFDKLQE